MTTDRGARLFDRSAPASARLGHQEVQAPGIFSDRLPACTNGDHYRGYGAVLARLDRLRTAEARLRLERAWRLKAPRTLIKRFDEGLL